MSIRSSTLIRTVVLLAVFGTAAASGNASERADEQRSHGQYLTNLLGCGRCHTEGYLTGNSATAAYFSGSRIGMAYTAYSIDEQNPGVVFAGNLTGDPETGLGNWSIEEIITAMTRGVARSGHERLLIMPWANYNALTRSDLEAIAHYLKSLAPVVREIPQPVPEGEPSPHPYVRYGVYEFTPHTPPEALEP